MCQDVGELPHRLKKAKEFSGRHPGRRFVASPNLKSVERSLKKKKRQKLLGEDEITAS